MNTPPLSCSLDEWQLLGHYGWQITMNSESDDLEK